MPLCLCAFVPFLSDLCERPFQIKSVKARITLATRKSPLALAQTDLVAAALRDRDPEVDVRRLRLTTTGDKRQAWSLQEKGGKGLFTKELEIALMDGRADLAVHSAKDLPTKMQPGLAIAGYLPRESAADVLIKRKEIDRIEKLATGSPRRRAQAKRFLPEVRDCEIRGNVETRLNAIVRGLADATILAQAGLTRLGIRSWEGLEFEALGLNQMIPAVGQGAIALQCREEEAEKFRKLSHPETETAVSIEREFLSLVGGGCQSAFAAHFRDGKLYAYHETAGRFTLTFNSLDRDFIRNAIQISLRRDGTKAQRHKGTK